MLEPAAISEIADRFFDASSQGRWDEVAALMEIDEPWPISVDRARQSDEEMFINLGGRELRALPS